SNASNWSPSPSCGSPGVTDTALIVTTATYMPTLTANVSISTLTVNSGTTTLTLNGYNLSLSSFTNGGNFYFHGNEQVGAAPAGLVGSSVTYNGTATNLPFLSTWTYRNVVIGGTGTFTTNGNTSINGNFTVNAGTISFSRVTSSTITMASGSVNVNAG